MIRQGQIAQKLNSEVVPQALKANWEYQVSLAFHSPVWFTFTTSAKLSGATKLCLTLPRYCKAFDSSKNICRGIKIDYMRDCWKVLSLTKRVMTQIPKTCDLSTSHSVIISQAIFTNPCSILIASHCSILVLRLS